MIQFSIRSGDEEYSLRFRTFFKLKTMKIIVVMLILCCSVSSIQLKAQEIETDFTQAQSKATQEDKDILMVFSGSDWCKPCIQLKKEVLETSEFDTYKNQHLIHLELDFPYKANVLSKEQLKHNESLAERYNPKGMFPEVLVVSKEGDVLKTVKYKKGMSTEQFIKKLKG